MPARTRLARVVPGYRRPSIPRQFLFTVIVLIFVSIARDVQGSAEYSALGTPKCDPPGRFRTGERLDFAQSKKNGAVVDSRGVSFIRTNQLGDCANWCCKLPAVNCSVATLEIKPSGANCHLLICYPTELCVFVPGTEYLSYDRTLFVPVEAYRNASSTATGGQPSNKDEDPHGSPSLSIIEHSEVHSDPQHDSAIKPRKGVGLPPPGKNGDAGHNRTTETAEGPVEAPTKRKTPVSLIFLYAALILGILALLAFLGQRFLDCWERRHYTRADYLLDGMYEDREDLKGRTACGH